MIFRHELFRNHIAPIIYDSIVILYEKIKNNNDLLAFAALKQVVVEIVMRNVSIDDIFDVFHQEIESLLYANEYIIELQRMYGRLNQ